MVSNSTIAATITRHISKMSDSFPRCGCLRQDIRVTSCCPQDANEPAPFERDEPQAWRMDIKSRTGYPSYSAYIRHHYGFNGNLDSLYQYIETSRNLLEKPANQCLVLELTSDSHVGASVEERYQGEWSTETLEHVLKPSLNAVMQIIIWLIPDDHHPDIRFLDSVGLLLQLDPEIFHALLSKRNGYLINPH